MARILIIDDDEALRSTLRRILERAGHVSLEAGDGHEGLLRVRQDGVDLVITDLIMPKTEGLELMLTLRREHPGLPVIAMSGGGRVGPESYLATVKLFGAVRTLAKPFTGETLLAAVDDVLGIPVRAPEA